MTERRRSRQSPQRRGGRQGRGSPQRGRARRGSRDALRRVAEANAREAARDENVDADIIMGQLEPLPPIESSVRGRGRRRPRLPSTSTSSDDGRPPLSFKSSNTDCSDTMNGPSRDNLPRSILKHSHTTGQRRRRSKRMRRSIVFNDYDEVYYIPSRHLNDEHIRRLRRNMLRRNLILRTRRGARVRKMVNGNGVGLFSTEVKPRAMKRTLLDSQRRLRSRNKTKKRPNLVALHLKRIKKVKKRRQKARKLGIDLPPRVSRSPLAPRSARARSASTGQIRFPKSPPTPYHRSKGRRSLRDFVPRVSPHPDVPPSRLHPLHPMTHHPKRRPNSPEPGTSAQLYWPYSDRDAPGSRSSLTGIPPQIPVRMPSAAARAVALESSEPDSHSSQSQNSDQPHTSQSQGSLSPESPNLPPTGRQESHAASDESSPPRLHVTPPERQVSPPRSRNSSGPRLSSSSRDGTSSCPHHSSNRRSSIPRATSSERRSRTSQQTTPRAHYPRPRSSPERILNSTRRTPSSIPRPVRQTPGSGGRRSRRPETEQESSNSPP